MDVMPDCAAEICKGISEPDKSKWPAKRQWRVQSDFILEEFNQRKQGILDKCDGQKIKTFISNQWTLEYDLAYSGLAKEVYLAAKLAIKDGSDVPANKTCKEVAKQALEDFESNIKTLDSKEKMASTVYSEFTSGTKASKAIAAQYLGSILEKWYADKPQELLALIPTYIKEAIEYVTEVIPIVPELEKQ